MRPRIAFARFLLRAGDFLRSLPLAVLRPADMIEWSRQGYERGDILFDTLEFRNAFKSEQKLREEFLAGGFAMPDIDVIIFDKMMRGGAILRKSELRERRGLNKFSVEGER